jgi:transcription initiation factor TFIID subunit 13
VKERGAETTQDDGGAHAIAAEGPAVPDARLSVNDVLFIISSHFPFALTSSVPPHTLNSPSNQTLQTTTMPIPPLPRQPLLRTHDKTSQALLTPSQVEAFLLAFGDNDYPLAETVRVLDEIITDYIIETCHEAASVAHHARRAKIKLDDFKFMLRRDTVKLGRVSDMLETDKELKRKRKAFDTDEGAVLGKGDKEDDAAGKKKGGGAGAGPEEGAKKKKRREEEGSTVG